MIQVEYLNEGTLIKHYSDEGKMLLQEETGIMWDGNTWFFKSEEYIVF